MWGILFFVIPSYPPATLLLFCCRSFEQLPKKTAERYEPGNKKVAMSRLLVGLRKQNQLRQLPSHSLLLPTEKCAMLDKLDAIKARFEQVGVALTNPEIINNQKEFSKFSKEYRSLEKIVQPYEEYRKVLADFDFVKDNLNSTDEEMKELAKMELPGLEERKNELEKYLTKLLIPKDPQDDKNAIIEILSLIHI